MLAAPRSLTKAISLIPARDRASPPELQAQQLHIPVFELDGMGKRRARPSRLQCEEQLVVAGDDDTLLVGQSSQPVIEIGKCFGLVFVPEKIARMSGKAAWRQAQIDRPALENLPNRIEEAVSGFSPLQRSRLAPLVSGLSLDAEKISHLLRPRSCRPQFRAVLSAVAAQAATALAVGASEARWRALRAAEGSLDLL